MVRGQYHGGAAAPGGVEKSGEAPVDLAQVLPGAFIIGAETVAHGVQLGPVGIYEATVVAVYDVPYHVEESLQGTVAAHLCLSPQGVGVTGVHQIPPLHDETACIEGVGDRLGCEQAARIDSGTRKRQTTDPGRERQRRRDQPYFPEPHEPAREGVLLGSAAGKKGGDGAGGGGWKNRGHGAAQMAAHGAIVGRPQEQLVAKPVDDQQNHLTAIAEHFRWSQGQGRVLIAALALCQAADDGLHQVHDTAPVVIGEDHGVW